jgi:hypothetical protein
MSKFLAKLFNVNADIATKETSEQAVNEVTVLQRKMR